jgi:hypothetical protein
VKTVLQRDDLKTVLTLQGDALVAGTVQDCTPIVEQAKALNREGIHGSKEMRHAAKFPAVIVEKYCNDKGISFQQFLSEPVHCRTMLADPALRDFRIWDKRV